MTHNIIDNQDRSLVEEIERFLPGTSTARFAVGYFFLSGFTGIADKLDQIDELRLLIGNTTTRETIEQIAEGYRRLDLVEERLGQERHVKRADRHERVAQTGEEVRRDVALMDQNDESEEMVKALVRMIEEGRLKVRVYTRGRLHAKAYIFDWRHGTPTDNGAAIVGSSNLTLAGISDNTELNVIVYDTPGPEPDSGNHGKLVSWFQELWDASEDFDEHLMQELKQSWAASLATPHEIYMKTLYTLVRDRLEGGPVETVVGAERINRQLADFQQRAVRQSVGMIRDYGGCFVSDVVGLGKSFVGAAIIKHFERTERKRALIICPKSLEQMWENYNQEYELNAEVLPMSMLLSGERGADLFNDPRYRDRDFILIDESHNFRHSETQKYQELQKYISANPDRNVCLLTATPRNSDVYDILQQIRLFHPEDVTLIPVDPPNLAEYFQRIRRENQEGVETTRLQDLLRHVLIRRTRRHVLRWYGRASDTHQPLSAMTDEGAAVYLDGEGDKRAYIEVGGGHNYFPKRELETLRYSIEDTYDGLYDQIRNYLGRGSQQHIDQLSAQPVAPDTELTYARYGLYNYLHPGKQSQQQYTDLHKAGRNLRGLIRTMLFKRFESSVEAFRETLKRMISSQQRFLELLDQGIVPAGEQAERLLSATVSLEDEDVLERIQTSTSRYNVDDFDIERLQRHMRSDIRLMREMLELVDPISPEEDDKLQSLIRALSEPGLIDRKRLIFTQYADTAEYLYQHLNGPDSDGRIEVIYGNDSDKTQIVGRFAPRANPTVHFRSGEREIQTLISTDVLAEGLNMQDCDVVINYDLHWNPVKLIQRFGRIDRIGSEHDRIWGYNFLPEMGIERNLGLTEILKNRIDEIHETIGEDSAILDRSERLNPDAMYAIYRGATSDLEKYDDNDEDQLLDLNEAEEFFRGLRERDPDEFERIASLRDGIRSARYGEPSSRYVFCEAGRYHRLYLVNDDGGVITSDISRVLSAIRSNEQTPGLSQLPPEHNQAVMSVQKMFSTEVQHRRTQIEAQSRLMVGQRYVLDQLRQYFNQLEEDEVGERETVNELDRVFRQRPTVAVRRELNELRREGVTGNVLIEHLKDIYHQHNLRERARHRDLGVDEEAIPHIVCSMALVG